MLNFDNLVPDTNVLDGEINPKEEIRNVLKIAAATDVVQTEAVKAFLNALGELYGLPDMKKITDLITKCQEEKIANIKNAL